MRLTRILDERIIALWKQGRGLGGTFNQIGHEAISVGAGAALDADDVVAPMHRDLGCYLLRGMESRGAATPTSTDWAICRSASSVSSAIFPSRCP
jgi:TPP-dependent pyruvate/acetoin dehydrogenase alpha subunit